VLEKSRIKRRQLYVTREGMILSRIWEDYGTAVQAYLGRRQLSRQLMRSRKDRDVKASFPALRDDVELIEVLGKRVDDAAEHFEYAATVEMKDLIQTIVSTSRCSACCDNVSRLSWSVWRNC